MTGAGRGPETAPALAAAALVAVAVVTSGSFSGASALAAVPFLLLAAEFGRRSRSGVDRVVWAGGLTGIAAVALVVGLVAVL